MQLTDAIRAQLDSETVYGVVSRGRRYDVGDKVGWLRATIELAMPRQEFRDAIHDAVSPTKTN